MSLSKLGIKSGNDANIGTMLFTEGTDDIHIQRIYPYVPAMNNINSNTEDTVMSSGQYLEIITDSPVNDYELLLRKDPANPSYNEGYLVIVGINGNDKPVSIGRWNIITISSSIADHLDGVFLLSSFTGQHPYGVSKIRLYLENVSAKIRIAVFPGSITSDSINNM